MDIDFSIFSAFSRDGPVKIYVQHLITLHSSKIWELLSKKKGHFYVCGDAKHMAHDVNNALEKIAESEGKLDVEGSKKWVKKLRSSGKYLEDIW